AGGAASTLVENPPARGSCAPQAARQQASRQAAARIIIFFPECSIEWRAFCRVRVPRSCPVCAKFMADGTRSVRLGGKLQRLNANAPDPVGLPSGRGSPAGIPGRLRQRRRLGATVPQGRRLPRHRTAADARPARLVPLSRPLAARGGLRRLPPRPCRRVPGAGPEVRTSDPGRGAGLRRVKPLVPRRATTPQVESGAAAAVAGWSSPERNPDLHSPRTRPHQREQASLQSQSSTRLVTGLSRV